MSEADPTPDYQGNPGPGGASRPAARAVATPVPNPTPETLRLYAADWRDFSQWCRTARQAALPASPETLAAYLLACAPRLGRGGLGRRRAAIGAMHRQHDLPVPALDKAARAAVRRVTQRPVATPAAMPSAPAALHKLAARCSRDLTGLRDCALLLLVAATRGEHRSPKPQVLRVPPSMGPGSEWSKSREIRLRTADIAIEETPPGLAVPRWSILELEAEHIRFTDQGVTVRLRARADDETPTRTVLIGRSSPTNTLCPVRALEDWLRASNTTFGPIFRKIDRWGNVEHARLGPDALRQILRRHTRTKAVRRPAAAA